MFRSPCKAVHWADLSQMGFQIKHLPTAALFCTGDNQAVPRASGAAAWGLPTFLGSHQAGELLQSKWDRAKGGTYQCPTAEEDHEDDEGLEPVVLHNSEAGFPDVPPYLPSVAGDVHIEAGKPLHAGWGWDKELWVTSWPGRFHQHDAIRAFIVFSNPPRWRLQQDPAGLEGLHARGEPRGDHLLGSTGGFGVWAELSEPGGCYAARIGWQCPLHTHLPLCPGSPALLGPSPSVKHSSGSLPPSASSATSSSTGGGGL